MVEPELVNNSEDNFVIVKLPEATEEGFSDDAKTEAERIQQAHPHIASCTVENDTLTLQAIMEGVDREHLYEFKRPRTVDVCVSFDYEGKVFLDPARNMDAGGSGEDSGSARAHGEGEIFVTTLSYDSRLPEFTYYLRNDDATNRSEQYTLRIILGGCPDELNSVSVLP